MTTPPTVRVAITVEGKVQGVGFRNWTYSQARLFGLCGWVRNAAGGTVEVCAEGSDAQVDELVDALKKGPRLAKISNVLVKKEPIESRSFSEFSILKE